MAYTHPFITTVARELALQNRKVQFKSNSFFKNLDELELAHDLGDKLLAEVSMFKTSLFPAMKYFKSGVDSALASRSNAIETITVQFIQMPPVLESLLKTLNVKSTEEPSMPDFDNVGYINKVNLDTVSDLKTLFITEKEPATRLVEPILAEMTDIDLKNFYNKYCIYFKPMVKEKDLDEDTILFTQAEFLRPGIDRLLNVKETLLLWASVATSLYEEFPTNKDVPYPSNAKLEIKNYLEQILSNVLSVYQNYVKNEILVVQTSSETKIIHVIQESFDKFSQEVKTSAYDVIYGTSAYLNRVLRTPDFNFNYTVKEVLDREEFFLRLYKQYVVYERAILNEKHIHNLRRQILNIASEVFTNFLTDELKQYTSIKTLSEFENAVVKHIKEVKDEELLDDSAKLTFEVIGKILFNKTNFGMFLESQQELQQFIESNGVAEDDEITLWTINFLIKFILTQIEVIR